MVFVIHPHSFVPTSAKKPMAGCLLGPPNLKALRGCVFENPSEWRAA